MNIRPSVEITLPTAWSAEQVTVKQAWPGETAVPVIAVAGGRAIRFHAAPRTAEYAVEKAR